MSNVSVLQCENKYLLIDVCPTKIQISLCIPKVWSESSLSAWINFASLAIENVPCKGLDKSGYQLNVFLISPQKHMLWYSLEAPHWGTSNEYQQHTFSWRNKKNINTFGFKKASFQKLCALWIFWSECVNVQADLNLLCCRYIFWVTAPIISFEQQNCNQSVQLFMLVWVFAVIDKCTKFS